jgi:hypothetical protein
MASSRLAENPCEGRAGMTTAPVIVHIQCRSSGILGRFVGPKATDVQLGPYAITSYRRSRCVARLEVQDRASRRLLPRNWPTTKIARHWAGGARAQSKGRLALTSDEIVGRLMVLEVFTTTAFALSLANAQNDPDFSKAGRLLEQTRESISSLAMTLPPEARIAAEQYASQLLTVLSQHLRDLTRGGE